MTTPIEIKNKSADGRTVLVEVVRDPSGDVLREHTLRPGQAVELYVFRGQAVQAREAG